MTLYQKALGDFRKGYMGFATLAIIGQSCFGSVAVMYILQNGTSFGQMIQLAAVVIACMILNGSILSQQKPKLVFDLLLVSILVSFVMIVLNTIFI
ncbi:hypothetical protein NAT51_10975 [Flavobacterium amniphilum]|uniref:hypothetical protein n=1 Tax=Flavobacterium amniphilum TaxID=1834035 RepID=UPI00202A6E3D|nr:hypothetical protein [Flavobacterium amniphilum]MCL9806050.1 hypothetical protein [Flavobacterium amniphilum]